MGVAGSGKTAVGQAVAARTGWPFLDGDDFHTPEARARMAVGEGLRDADRWPWLVRLCGQLESRADVVLACSALKWTYRDALRGEGVRFVFLNVPEALLRLRLEHRAGHYAHANLLPSQLATLQVPGPDELDVLTLSVTFADSPEELAGRALERLAVAHA
ncbi:gluconokinase [Deinococcus hopiensis KR-140]|uniref:Gluconokinase n=2 Tax=Deinococcus TaxID=1298 RepID=A0A1W1VPJ7_9DEIO|nr:gluconokinase [Deinococcus hopiensis KR-140]